MIDLDAFKALNGRHGHEAGDRLLQEIAGSWQVAVRGGGDFLARLGGNEFRLLAPGSDSTGAHHLAKRLGDVRPESVGFSIGMATWDGDETARNLVRRADQAMYREAGKAGTPRPPVGTAQTTRTHRLDPLAPTPAPPRRIPARPGQRNDLTPDRLIRKPPTPAAPPHRPTARTASRPPDRVPPDRRTVPLVIMSCRIPHRGAVP